MDSTVTVSGPVFDGRAQVAMRDAAEAIRHRLASEAERITYDVFLAAIRHNRGVFLSAITDVNVTTTEEWTESWTRDIDAPGGGEQRVTRTYSMPVVVGDPVSEEVVTTEVASYGPWLEGTGSRNVTTRFKGYHGYRLAAQRLNTESVAISNVVIDPYVEACNA